MESRSFFFRGSNEGLCKRLTRQEWRLPIVTTGPPVGWKYTSLCYRGREISAEIGIQFWNIPNHEMFFLLSFVFWGLKTKRMSSQHEGHLTFLCFKITFIISWSCQLTDCGFWKVQGFTLGCFCVNLLTLLRTCIFLRPIFLEGPWCLGKMWLLRQWQEWTGTTLFSHWSPFLLPSHVSWLQSHQSQSTPLWASKEM